MVAWLQTHCNPQSILMDYSHKTAKHRLSFIHGEEQPIFTTINNQWPRYVDPEGYLLVSLFSVILHLLEEYCTFLVLLS